jgi:hypothetical protein
VVDLLKSGTQRWSKYGYCVPGVGNYKQRISSFGGPVRRAASDRRNALSSVEWKLELNDMDRFSDTIEGAGERFAGVTARVYLAAKGVAKPDWMTRFQGRVFERGRLPGMRFGLTLRPDDAPLVNEVPRVSAVRSDWPNLPQANEGLLFPLGLGLHDSTSSKAAKTSDGAVPLLYVDNVGFRYALLGWWLVLRVYVSGVYQSTGYTLSHDIVRGKPFTIVDFSADKGTAPVTVDTYGLSDTGAATGAPVMNPVDQLRLLLDHVVYGTSLEGAWSGTWPTVNSICDASSFAAVGAALKAGGKGYGGALFVDAPTTGLDLLARWGEDFGVTPFWKGNGLLGLRYDNAEATAAELYSGAQVVRYPQHFVDTPEVHPDGADDIVDRLIIQTSNVKNLGRYLQQIEVFDPLSRTGVAETLSPTWGPASE